VTGRLSDTLVRIDDGVVTAESSAVHWPYSPSYDARRDRLWLLAHTTGVVWGLDASTLEEEVRWPLPVGPNPLFTFSEVLWAAPAARLFAAESNADTVYELDPDTGEVLSSWPLGGPAIADWEAIGELALRTNADGDALYLARTLDGRLQRLDLGDGTLTTVSLGAEELATLTAERKVDLLRVFSERAVLWFGGFAFDPDTLERLPERDLDAQTAVAFHPQGEQDWIGLSGDGTELRHNREGEGTLSAVGIAQRSQQAVQARLSFTGDHVWVTRARDGCVCPFERP
jgi:hypothetical protein